MKTKKDIKSLCSFHVYGRGKNKRNAIYYDYAEDLKNGVRGYKFMVKGKIENCSKAELFNTLCDWVNEKTNVPYWVEYKFAHTEKDRFKVLIVG